MRADDLTALTEQAALGAFLLRPAGMDEVRGWLRPADFADAWHGWVFTMLLEAHTAHRPIDPVATGADLTDRYGTRLANLPRLHTLIAATPHAEHAPEYARIVADIGLRREIAGLGVLLRAAASQAVFEGAAVPLTATCNLVDAGLDAAAARWAAATGTPHDEVVVPLALRAASRSGQAREAAARYLDAHPARDNAAEQRHVVDLVGTLIAHPEHIPAVTEWLPVARIADPAWRLIYAATVEQCDLGRPVDLVTVAAAAHRYAHHGPDLPALRELRDAVDAGWMSWPPQVIRTAAGDQIRRLADLAADQLTQGAANPGVQIGEIADTGHAFTATLRHTATALSANADARTVASAAPVARVEGLRR